MKKFLISDIHIGHKDAQYEVMDQAISYIRNTAGPGDEVWGLGDWFHMYENGFEFCLKNPMTQKFRDLAGDIPIKLVPGNHDHVLEKFRDNPALENPLSPIKLAKPFMADGLWYCHGHEYDPAVEYIPYSIMWIFKYLPLKQVTPGNLRGSFISERFLMLANLVHARALLNLVKRNKYGQLDCKGIVLGHTHLPIHQLSPELPFLLNDGDMRHSSTFTVEDEKEFIQMTWDADAREWRKIIVPTP